MSVFCLRERERESTLPLCHLLVTRQSSESFIFIASFETIIIALHSLPLLYSRHRHCHRLCSAILPQLSSGFNTMIPRQWQPCSLNPYSIYCALSMISYHIVNFGTHGIRLNFYRCDFRDKRPSWSAALIHILYSFSLPILSSLPSRGYPLIHSRHWIQLGPKLSSSHSHASLMS